MCIDRSNSYPFNPSFKCMVYLVMMFHLHVSRLNSGCSQTSAVATVYQWTMVNQSKQRIRLHRSYYHLPTVSPKVSCIRHFGTNLLL